MTRDLDHVEFVHTAGMDRESVEERLEETQVGVLGLANGTEAYAIPVAFQFLGDRLCFRLSRVDGSRKMAFIESTDRATFVVYGFDSPSDSWSILIEGPIRVLSDAESEQFDDALINKWFAQLRVFDEPIDEIELVLVELEIESMTGRETLD